MAAIAYAGDEQSLREASKLMKINEGRFGNLVRLTLANAYTLRNAFTVAYRGFAIGDPAVDRRMIVWAEEKLGHKNNDIREICRRSWAEAMVEKYDGAPSELQWVYDPIASRLKPSEIALLHEEMMRFAGEAVIKRGKR